MSGVTDTDAESLFLPPLKQSIGADTCRHSRVLAKYPHPPPPGRSKVLRRPGPHLAQTLG